MNRSKVGDCPARQSTTSRTDWHQQPRIIQRYHQPPAAERPVSREGDKITPPLLYVRKCKLWVISNTFHYPARAQRQRTTQPQASIDGNDGGEHTCQLACLGRRRRCGGRSLASALAMKSRIISKIDVPPSWGAERLWWKEGERQESPSR